MASADDTDAPTAASATVGGSDGPGAGDMVLTMHGAGSGEAETKGMHTDAGTSDEVDAGTDSAAVARDTTFTSRTSQSTSVTSVFANVQSFVASQQSAYQGIVHVLCERIDRSTEREMELTQRVEHLEQQLQNFA